MIKIFRNKTASMDIDAQNGFTTNCPDELPVCEAKDIVDEMNKSKTKAKFRYASKDAHPEYATWNADEKNEQYTVVGLPNVDIRWNKHCVTGTFGFELLSGLPHMSEYDFFVYKGVEKDMHPYSPCYHDLSKKISTGIIEKAYFDGITTFILNGLALNIESTPLCLGSAALDLNKAGFNVIVNLGATRGLGSEDGRLTFIESLKSLGIIFVNSADEIYNEEL
jgi:nicotinamidase/pyrazinamidase